MKIRGIALASLLFALPSIGYAMQNTLNRNNMELEEKVMTETGLSQEDKVNKIWQEYLEGKRKMPKRFQRKGAKHPYFCCAFVQQRLIEAYGLKVCKEKGVIRKNGERMGGTWNLLDSLRDNECVVWEKEVMSSDILKEEIENQELDYYKTLNYMKGRTPAAIKRKFPGLMERLEETNYKEIEESLQQGDILFSLYPGSLFNKENVTHTYIVLGKKNNKWMVFQEWGHAIEIMELDKLYSRVPGGIDAVARLSK